MAKLAIEPLHELMIGMMKVVDKRRIAMPLISLAEALASRKRNDRKVYHTTRFF